MKAIAVHKRYVYMGDRDELVQEFHEIRNLEAVSELVKRLLRRSTLASPLPVWHPREWVELRLLNEADDD
ncbi:MAG: hypothetical protein AMS18_00250 [Gemmatimonas sp. SG8_17]|nr:MAG: hypothetical protein AMS18_00250 [Gemmatimonas sp. SG8_17]